MLSLKWGDVLSTLLPGTIVVLAISPYFPLLQWWLSQLEKVGPGIALLMASALAGEILGAVTRIFWERLFLVRRHPSKNVLPYLRDNAQNVDLYERGVQNSYKYVTFYANFAWAVALFLLVRLIKHPKDAWLLLLVALVGLLLRASYVQWTYFVNYQTQVFGPRSDNDAGQRSAAGNESAIHS